MEAVIANARAELFFIDYAPVLVTSALTGEHADKIFKMIERIRRLHVRISAPAKLNRALRMAFAANPPPMVKGKRLKAVLLDSIRGNESREFAPTEVVLFVNSLGFYHSHMPVSLKRRFVSSSPTRDYQSCSPVGRDSTVIPNAIEKSVAENVKITSSPSTIDYAQGRSLLGMTNLIERSA
jgi:hypothetical protein